MGSITDFNNNSRGVQGGIGFAGNPPNSNIYQHGLTQGASDALDAMTLWVETVRAPFMPVPGDSAALTRGRTIFAGQCASCHGGPKWTKSQVVYRDNPAFNKDPAAGGVPLDPGVKNTAAQVESFALEGRTLRFLENVGTFNATDALEIRATGILALGGLGFNVPSLLGIGYHAPYLHNGKAQTIEAVFPLHVLGAGTIEAALTAAQRQDLALFLKSIDGRTVPFRSATDDFRDAIGD